MPFVNHLFHLKKKGIRTRYNCDLIVALYCVYFMPFCDKCGSAGFYGR
jgi:hypothetical protein